MKKFIKVFCVAIFVASLAMSVSTQANAVEVSTQANAVEVSIQAMAVEVQTLIDSKIGQVFEGSFAKVELYGTFRNKGLYAENICIKVTDCKTKKIVATIHPTTDSGYQPKILLENFTDAKTQQIFLGMSSGGSGGYGNFYVYDLTSGKAQTIFDYEKWDKAYTARYVDNFKVEIIGKTPDELFTIDISKRSKDYLLGIYDVDGKVKKGVTMPTVWAINYVFPFFNSTDGKFQLQVIQRITGQYNADSLGYVINQMKFDGKNFESYFTYVGIL